MIWKGFKGMKSDQPLYFNEVTKKLVSAEFMELFINADSDSSTNPLSTVVDYIRSAFVQLPNVNLNELAFSQATKALYEYKKNGKERQMWNEILEDCGGDVELAKSKSQTNNVYYYWKIIAKAKERSVTIHLGKYPLNIDKYREELFKCIEPILEAYGMKEEGLDALYLELIGRKRPKKKFEKTVEDSQQQQRQQMLLTKSQGTDRESE